MQIAIFSLFALLVGCATADDAISDDPVGRPGDKTDEAWWKPTRDLAIDAQFYLLGGSVGNVMRGTFDPDVYAGSMFTVDRDMRATRFTRSIIGDDAMLPAPYHTEPLIFRWRGEDSASVTDWASWSLISHCCNNFEVTLQRGQRYLLVVTTTANAYEAGARYAAYLRPSDAPATRAPLRGALRCGPSRLPVVGATMSLDTLPTEHVMTDADGAFAFDNSYAVGAHQLYSMFDPADHVGAFGIVIAPDGSTVELLLEHCP